LIRWLGDVARRSRDDAGGRWVIGECTLPAGHNGTHDDDGAGRLVAARITGEPPDLADAVGRIGSRR
jgi:hypothetical protein